MADANWISIARPYAKAAFDSAVGEKKLHAWSGLLKQAALLVKEKSMQSLLKDPRFDKMLAYECLGLGCKPWLFYEGENFLKLVALQQRLLVIPEIEHLFSRYKAEQANQVTAQVVSAIALTKREEQALEAALERRLQREEVKLNYFLDSSLLGGLVIRVGDWVIDSSVRGKLERLRMILVN